MARGFLSGLLPGRDDVAKATTSDAIARATGGSSAGVGNAFGMGQVSNWDVDKAVRDGLERSTWVFRAVDVIATNQASQVIGLKRSHNTKHEWIDNPRLERLLNFRPNTYETAFQFRYRLTGIALLSRRGVFIEVLKGRDGLPAQLHILPPGSTLPIPDAEKFVAGYKVTRSDFKVETLEPERVIWLRNKPHPTDPYLQLTPLMAAGLSADIDYFARLFNRNFLMRDGRPGMLIGIKGMANPLDADELKRRFTGGPERAGSTTVIESEDISVIDTSASPRDVQWGELLRGSKEEILMAFGVPESVMGNASGRTFANADAERESFWLDTMKPHCDSIASGLDAITGSTNDDMVWAFRYEDIDILQRAAAAKRAEWRSEVKDGVRTIDSYFEAIGEEKWDVPATRALWQANQIVIGRDEKDQEAIDKMQRIGQGTPEDGQEQDPYGQFSGGGFAQQPDPQEVESRFDELLAQQAAQSAASYRPLEIEPPGPGPRGRKSARGRVRRVRRVIEQKSDDDTHRALDRQSLYSYAEGMVDGVVTGWSDRQADVITDRLNHVKSRKGTRHWSESGTSSPVDGPAGASGGQETLGVQTKALDANYAVEIDRWVTDLVGVLTRRLERTVRKAATQATRELQEMGVLPVIMADRGQTVARNARLIDLVFNDMDTMYLGDVYSAIARMVTEAATAQTQRVVDKISLRDSEGATMNQIESDVKKMIGQRAAWRRNLSRNVVTTAVEGARHAVFAQAGDYVVKEWHSHFDEKTRASHVQADKQKAKMGETFFVGLGDLRFPGDPLAPVEETINCRCWLTFEKTPAFLERISQ